MIAYYTTSNIGDSFYRRKWYGNDETTFTSLNEPYQTVEKPYSRAHTFSYWLNYILADPPDPFFVPTVEKPLTKPKTIKYINVKLARAPPKRHKLIVLKESCKENRR